jgi:arylsulfatase
MQPLETAGIMFLETNSEIIRLENKKIPTDVIEMKDVYFPEMECDLIPHYATEGKYPNYGSNGKYILPLWIELEKLKE